MRIVFMGTPALAVPALELLRNEHEVLLVVTQPDKPGGRGHKLLAPPVKEYALANGLVVSQPERARDENFAEQLRDLKPEAIAVVAYGQILPRSILEMPQENHPHGGCINLHYSLLPRWRGAAPVQYAVWHGDTVTGVSTQWMAEKLDAGDILLQREVPIEPNETAGELFEKLTPLGAQVLLESMRLLESGQAPRLPQNEDNATFCPTIKKEESFIDWNGSATQIVNHIRAFNPRPVAQCVWNDAPLKIQRARRADSGDGNSPGTIIENRERVLVTAGEDAVELLEVQPPGKPRMNACEWARGARLEVGQKMT